MTNELQRRVFDNIAAELKGINLDSDIMGEGKNQTLRLMTAFTEEAHAGIIDINLVTLAQGLDAAQLYATLFVDLSDDIRAELEKAIPYLNFISLIGTYGIYGGNQLYCKYGLTLPDTEDDVALSREILDKLPVFYNLIDCVYPLIYDMANGKITFGEAVKQGKINGAYC